MNPGPFFNHKKHLSNHFYHFSIFCHLKIRKYKNTFTSCIHHIKPKNIIYHCYHHPCIFIYHHCIFISCLHCILSWYHSHTLCLTTTRWGWGPKHLLCFVGNQKKDRKDKSSLLIPREFDIKPSSHPSWGKHVFHLLHTLHLESQPNPFTFHAGNYVKGHQDCFLAPLPGNHCWKVYPRVPCTSSVF